MCPTYTHMERTIPVRGKAVPSPRADVPGASCKAPGASFRIQCSEFLARRRTRAAGNRHGRASILVFADCLAVLVQGQIGEKLAPLPGVVVPSGPHLAEKTHRVDDAWARGVKGKCGVR